jgi:hypothetical protein
VYDNVESFVLWAQAPTLTTMFFIFGLWDGVSLANGCGFVFDTNVDALLRARTTTGGVPVNTTMTAVSTLSKYEIRMSTGQADFYLDNVLVATHTTGLPTGVALSPYIVVGNRAAVLRSLVLDVIYVRSKLLTR